MRFDSARPRWLGRRLLMVDSKKSKPLRETEESKVPTPVNIAPTETPPLPRFKAPSLQNIRDQILTQQTHNAQIIAELELWRKEIDATIAFMRSQDRK